MYRQNSNQACRLFLGFYKYAPIAAIQGDMGWINSKHRRYLNMIKYWNRLIDMQCSRLTKKIFLWDAQCAGDSWTSDIRKIFGLL